jgi:LmbE family N-acetylglucosaminyl deacetylase
MAKHSKGTVLVICAHSDDQSIGCGGSMAKYAKEGYDVHTIIMSFGENVKPHIKREVIANMRVKESKRADKILGGKGVTFLGLKELAFEDEIKQKGVLNRLDLLVNEIDPVKIFTHAIDDAHPDHRATLRIVLRLYRRLTLKCELYTFEVWHIFNLKKRRMPKLVKFFPKKRQSLLAFKSQVNLSNFYNYLVLNNFFFFVIHIKDFLNGLKYGYKYAEVFYKLR